jgi:hypothetical protein
MLPLITHFLPDIPSDKGCGIRIIVIAIPTAVNTTRLLHQLRRNIHSAIPTTMLAIAIIHDMSLSSTASKIPALSPAKTGSAGTYDNGGFTAPNIID